MNRISTLLCLYLAIGSQVTAQTFNFHTSFDSSFVPGGNYLLVGKISDNYLLLYSDKEHPTKLVICDQKGAVLREKTYDFINDSSTVAVNLVPGKTIWSLVLQSVVGNIHYTETVKLDANGEILKGREKIDSTRHDKFQSAAIYNMTSSRNGEYFLLYRILRGFATDHLVIDYILLDKSANKIGSKSFFIPFKEQFEALNNIFLAPDGTVYFTVHDKALGYRLGSKLRLYESDLASQEPTKSEIILNENMPIEIAFDADPTNKFIALGVLYANYNTKIPDGILTVFYNPATNRVETIANLPMEKDFKKEMKKRNINAKQLAAMTKLEFFKVNPDKSVSIVADIVSSRNDIRVGVPNGFYTSQPAPSIGTSSSQSFDQMRNNLYETQLPGSNAIGTSVAYPLTYRPQTMPDWNRQMNWNQSETLGNTLWQETYNSNYQNNFASAVKNSQMVLKSIVFKLDVNHKLQWKNLAQNSYVPNSPFTSVKTISIGNNVSLLSYEFEENSGVFLQQQNFGSNGKIATQPIGTSRMPLLFHGGNMLSFGEREILTIYFDPVEYRVGLASIVWQ